MIYLPVSVVLSLVLILLLPFIWVFFTLDVVELATSKLGFSPSVAFVLLAAILIGSTINIPLDRVESNAIVAKEIQRTIPGVLSIGGAGVFDGIALCGLFALLSI